MSFEQTNFGFQPRKNSSYIKTDYEGAKLENNEAQNLFKNVILDSILGSSMTNSIKFKCYSEFENSIRNIYRLN